MNPLSNFTVASAPAPGIICRPARNSEMLLALQWILGKPQQPAGEAQAADFIRFAQQRGIDLERLWLATVDQRMHWAALPVTSPGRSMLLFVPADVQNAAQTAAATCLLQRLLDEYADQGIYLAQALLNPADQRVIDLFTSLSFQKMAELVYLQIHTPSIYAAPEFPVGCRLLRYSAQTHALFAQAIIRSYQQSLDCPALAGLRCIEDVIAGHKSAGKFDANLWFVLLRRDEAVGVVLLTPLPVNQSMELVYLGLAPEARGIGLADLMLRLALSLTALSPYRRINFAVDSLNQPAFRLYYRHGAARVASKLALLRDLRE